MSSFTVFEIGKSALLAARRTMDVTSHNVANAATPGYSRQSVILEPLIQREAQISGVGVRAAQIVRARDAFLDAVLRSETGKKSAFSVEKDVMDNIQVIVAEPSDNSIRFTVEAFWASWQGLSIDPTSVSARASVTERGRSVVDMFGHMDGQLESLAVDIEANIAAIVSRVNTLADRAVSLNGEIARAIARQEPVGDLLDRRDLILDEISEITGATVSRLDDRTMYVRVGIGGFPVVDGLNSYKLEVAYPSGVTEFRWVDSAGNPQAIDTMRGRLGGLKTARDELVGSFKQDLEDLFSDIVDAVNTQHALGYAPDGTQTGDFFTVGNPGDYLGSTEVAAGIVADPSTIAASSSATDPLDGGNALAIADALESDCVDQWTAMIGSLGAVGQKIQSGFETEELLVKELQNRRDSVSGVSIDEEMANLVREQHAFNAASRLITTADEMMDTIINRMGLTGR
jgi:flagellar hook-associated protein 1 FlgK